MYLAAGLASYLGSLPGCLITGVMHVLDMSM